MTFTELSASLFALAVATAVSAWLTWTFLPFLQRYALTLPTPRSSHDIPTPQGGGIAVIGATLSAAAVGFTLTSQQTPLALFGATAFLALVGFIDDITSIPIIPRLLLQTIAIGAIIVGAPADLRIVSTCPLAVERGLLLFAGLWFVNLVNFMDGIDLMTVSEVVPVTAAMIILGSFNELPAPATLIAASLCGGLIGFVPFNRPVAKVFLGDVGSLPIGLLLGWCLLQLAWHQQLGAALLLSLYYLADSTLTLLRRITQRQKFWIAHRAHYYQRAVDNGYSVLQVVGMIFALNICLGALAIVSSQTKSHAIEVLLLLVGSACVGWVIYRFTLRRTS
jgi:UDP-N-acetylmuramyl pentapeptide phosphotransferase/UDP-N-acetylglucosamine-1-phosphate transferase